MASKPEVKTGQVMKSSTAQVMWDLLNTPDTIADFTAAWNKFRKRASFPQMLQAYDLVRGMIEAHELAGAKPAFAQVVFLGEDLTREQWLAKYTKPELLDARGDA